MCCVDTPTVAEPDLIPALLLHGRVGGGGFWLGHGCISGLGGLWPERERWPPLGVELCPLCPLACSYDWLLPSPRGMGGGFPFSQHFWGEALAGTGDIIHQHVAPPPASSSFSEPRTRRLG